MNRKVGIMDRICTDNYVFKNLVHLPRKFKKICSLRKMKGLTVKFCEFFVFDSFVIRIA